MKKAAEMKDQTNVKRQVLSRNTYYMSRDGQLCEVLSDNLYLSDWGKVALKQK